MKKILIFTLLLFISPLLQAAEDYPDEFLKAIKVKNPDQLDVYYYAATECPLTKHELKELVSGVLIRSRVKPLLGVEWVFDSLYLNVALSCIERKSTNQWIYKFDIYFGRWDVEPPISYQSDYDSFGIGPKQFIKDHVKENVENAMTAFIKANFNL